MLTPEYQKVLIAHVEAETAHRMDDTLATLTEDCVCDDRALGRVWHGREGARDYYRMWWDGFAIKPEGSTRFTPSGDILIVETRFVGTHQGTFLGIAPTGKPVDVPMAIFVSFAGGLMSGERFYWNPADLMAQVGVEIPFALAA
jgi:steroid delta-isomerase-like uncharacterized protein